MNRQELNTHIDTNVTNKTEPNSLTPTDEGNALKAVADYVDQEKRPYKVYTATLNQSGSNNPTALVFENSIGTIAWTRFAEGVYQATLSNAIFTVNKTLCFPDRKVMRRGPSGEDYMVSLERQSNTVVRLNTSSNYVNVDGIMVDLFVEIRVYN